MGIFDRFTGKELAQSIDTYTNQYAEILLGMHQQIVKHQQQLSNLQKQVNLLIEEKERYPHILDIDKEIFAINVQLTALQEELKENERRLDDNLRSAIAEVHETFSDELSNVQRMIQDQLKDMNELYLSRMSDLNSKLLALENEISSNHQQLVEANHQLQQRLSASESKYKKISLILGAFIFLLVGWEIIQFFTQ